MKKLENVKIYTQGYIQTKVRPFDSAVVAVLIVSDFINYYFSGY